MANSLHQPQNITASQEKAQQKSQGSAKNNSLNNAAIKKTAVTTLIKYLEKKA
jgi:hypothetical protein